MTQENAVAWIATLFNVTPDRLSPNTLRGDIEEWDSLGALTLMASLDSDFDITLSDDDVLGMQGVADILEILRKNGKLE